MEKKNFLNKIKFFENPETQYTTHINFSDSTQVEEEANKLISPPIAKPKRKKRKPIKNKQAKYVNIVRVEGAEAQWDTSFNNYPQFDSTQQTYSSSSLQPFDLAQSEYANLLPLGISDTERFYVDPEGSWVTIKKNQPKASALEETQEAAQSMQFDLAQSEYASLLPLSTPDTKYYVDPEGEWTAAKEKQVKKPTIKAAPIEGVVQYAELDLTQPAYLNILQKTKLDTISDSEYFHLGPDNTLTPSNTVNLSKDVLQHAARDEREKSESLQMKSVVAPSVKNKTQLKRKKNIAKDNCPGSLSVKFEKLNIQTIQEEPTLGESCVLPDKEQNESVKKPFRLKFFSKPKKSMQEIKESIPNVASMQNK